MSKGDELWEKRGKLLKYLYGKGAIDPDCAADMGKVGEAIGVDSETLDRLVGSLLHEQLVDGMDDDTADSGRRVFLTGAGFSEARGIVVSEE